ncbi:alpha/beta hydrolase family protein [uncultured Bacteroides sp.]|uniref:dienelactone hydrolase family protein n=1 Tax=uncultured Bacteroides sp. TaxID=162156 RepID=UPI002AAC20BF|nr:alpha/beta hydrolase family protein [uncultured Bacteroides sp.]
MKKSLFALCLCPLFSLQLSAQQVKSQDYTPYGVEKNMPSSYQKMKETLTYPMAWGKSPIKDFNKWKKEGRKILFSCLNPAPPTASFDMKVLEKEQRNGYEARKIALNISGFDRIPAYLLVPNKGKGPYPAVVMLHDHGAKFSIGKEKMIRPFGVSPEVLADADKWAVQCYDSVYVGDYFATHGYVVLSIDALFWGERGRKEGVNYDAQQALACNLMQMGYNWCGVITFDDIRSVDFLSSLPEVDPARIGTLGFSMGAHRAWMLSAATDKVKAGAAICWMNTTDSLMTLTNNQNKGGSAWSMLVPGIRNYMDYPDVASLACPKPMLFFNGLRDKLFPVNGVKDAYKSLHSTWNSQNADNKLVTKFWDGPHFFSKEMQKETLDFFDKFLKK